MTTTDKKVLFVATESYSVLGGIQQFNRRVISNLADLCATRPRALLLRDDAAAFPSGLNADLTAFPNRLRLTWATFRAARHAEVLLVGHINLLPIVALARLANPRLRVCLFAHGDEVWSSAPYRQKRFYEPFLLRLVDRVAAVSQFTARRMAHSFHLPLGKFIILPNAVDPIEYQASWTREDVVLAVSRLAEHDRGKNLDALITAFAGVTAQHSSARLVVIGDGPLLGPLQNLSRELGIAERVEFRGQVSDLDRDAAYGTARLFALPSSKEGFGIVFLEAWQRGLPVICGTTDAACEIVSDGEDGLAVDPGDTAALTQKMILLLNDHELADRMGRSGAAKVQRCYLNDAFRNNLLAVIQSMAGAANQ